MKIHIEYCERWNYHPQFDRVSKIIKEINSNINIEGNLKQPRSGSFEVEVNGKIVFSKFKTNKFPTKSEVESWIGTLPKWHYNFVASYLQLNL